MSNDKQIIIVLGLMIIGWMIFKVGVFFGREQGYIDNLNNAALHRLKDILRDEIIEEENYLREVRDAEAKD